MSDRKRPDADELEGREALEEETPSLAPNPELEAAMEEAAAAVEARQAERSEGDAAGEGGESQALAAELEETRDRLLRLQADFENFRRRTLKEREESFQYGHQDLLRDLLPSVDNLERALEHAREEGGESAGLLEGVELVLREILGVLTKHGVSEIDAADQPFDPAIHEAMAQAPAPDVPANQVIQVVQKGYQLRDRLLRASGVIVSKGPADSD